MKMIGKLVFAMTRVEQELEALLFAAVIALVASGTVAACLPRVLALA